MHGNLNWEFHAGIDVNCFKFLLEIYVVIPPTGNFSFRISSFDYFIQTTLDTWPV